MYLDNTLSLEFIDIVHLATFKASHKLSRINQEICCIVLITEGVTANNDRLGPKRNKSGNILDDDGFSEHSPVEEVSDCAIGGFPHFFKVEFFDSCLIGSNGSTFNANFAFFDEFGGVQSDLVVSFVPVLYAEIKVLSIEFKVGLYEIILDLLPDNSGHFIAIKISHGVLNLDFAEACQHSANHIVEINNQDTL